MNNLYLCYCVGVWGSTYPSNLKRVVTLQKRAIRITSKSKFHAHTDPLFKELKMLKLDSIVRFHICIVGVWGSTYPSNLKRVVTLQKRAIRIISKSKFHAHTDPLFKELKMLKLDFIIRFHICIVNINYDICKFMFLYRHGLLLESFDNMFPLDFHLTMKFIAIIHIILSRDLAFLCPVL